MEAEAPRERPILFSDPMVEKILSGQKTKTRRLVRVAPSHRLIHIGACEADRTSRVPTIRCTLPLPGAFHSHLHVNRDWDRNGGALVTHFSSLFCPYGAVGDRLWVRETWRPVVESWSCGVEYRAGARNGEHVMNRLSSDAVEKLLAWVERSGGVLRLPGARREKHSERWRPSIHMPRWASRIVLEIVSVSAERLHAITNEEVFAEGVAEPCGGRWLAAGTATECASPRDAFATGWDHLNADRAPWASNPWVWVVGFKRADTTPEQRP